MLWWRWGSVGVGVGVLVCWCWPPPPVGAHGAPVEVFAQGPRSPLGPRARGPSGGLDLVVVVVVVVVFAVC